MTIDREFSRMSVDEGAVEAFLYYMADDMTIYPRFGHPIQGKETYRKISAAAGDAGKKSRLEWEPCIADVSRAGDLGYTLGRYTLTITEASEEVQVKYGYYVTIWKRQPGGSWKFVFDAGNDSPSPSKASERIRRG